MRRGGLAPVAATSATTAATGTAVAVAELQHQIEAAVVARGAIATMVAMPVPVPPVAVEALPLVIPTGMCGRAGAEVPAVSDLLVLLLHLRGARTSWSGRARQGRAAERGHGKSQGTYGD